MPFRKVSLLFLLLSLSSLSLAIGEKVEGTILIRPRWELVKSGKDANAFTIKTAVGWKVTSLFNKPSLQSYIEFNNTSALLRRYNSTSASGPSPAGLAGVVDPTFTRVTQAFVRFQRAHTFLFFGRKALLLDDQRLVGNVGWRQTPQTFTVIEVEDRSLPHTLFRADLLFQRKGIKEEIDQNYKKSSFLIFTSVDPSSSFSFRFTALFLENLHNTYLLSTVGRQRRLHWRLGFGLQKSPSIRDKRLNMKKDARFYRARVSWLAEPFSLGIAYTHLGKDRTGSSTGFATPLATLHKFEGFADVLLGKAAAGDANGVRDITFSGRYKEKEQKTSLIYHLFRSVVGGKDYGQEWDVSYSRKLSTHLSLLFKLAYYAKGRDFGMNTKKVWLMFNYKQLLTRKR